MTIREGSRVLYADQAASVVHVEADTAYIRLDTQRPSSDPKPVPLTSLTLLAALDSHHRPVIN